MRNDLLLVKRSLLAYEKSFMTSRRILLLEDDSTLRNAIQSFLTRAGNEVVAFDKVESASGEASSGFDLILSDVQMQGLTGYDLLDRVKQESPDLPVILMTAYGTIEKAVEAMKRGAYDFLVKPFSLRVLETAVEAAFLDRESLRLRSSPHRTETGGVYAQAGAKGLLTHDPKVIAILDQVQRIASSKATIMIQGESGTGKELLAHLISQMSPRAERIFVAINCAAMPDTLLESELFGHEKGAFTGAFARQIGKFELANNGTILLDEISEMSLPMQAKLLRVLQESEIYRLGGVKPVPLNIRVIATTNRDLYQYMKQGHFREDLFYRLNVIPLSLPPLRERTGDLLFLLESFLAEYSKLHGKKPLKIDEAVKQKAVCHSWPGNIRELKNAVERAVLVGSFDVLDEFTRGRVGDEEEEMKPSPLPKGDLSLTKMEKRAIGEALRRAEGNKTHAARLLGISPRTLRNKVKSYRIKIAK